MLWLLFEKGINLSFVLAVNIFMARELGPQKFGLINYLLAMTSIILATAPIGVNAIVVKDVLSSPPKLVTNIIYNSLFLRAIGSIVVMLIFALLVYLDVFTGIENKWLYLVLVSAIASIFYLFDFYFQAKQKAKYSVLSRMSIVFLFSAIKLWLIYFQYPFEFLIVTVLLEPLCLAIIYSLVFIRVFNGYRKPNMDFTYIKSVFKRSKWLIFSSISSVICLKVDQLMLGEMSSMNELGNYAIAVRFSEVWYFIPAIIMTSYFPKLISLKGGDNEKYNGYLQLICNKLLAISVVIAVVMFFISDVLISTLYGKEYLNASNVLIIHIFGSIFVFMRALFSKWIVNEGLYKFSLLTHSVAALVNVVLNIILIPKAGGVGAAWATVLSYVLSSYLILVFFNETRQFFCIMSRSLSLLFVFKALRALLLRK